ncbi:unnamed protein product [Paramecium sonneborni]|uniref:Uncharacterized protein n=1 Tax=Paramecium sonneborni TaxID=65129 RepID=A0A8S1L554_9CILI|nr:unnamed protein product [Paramecium sonneborni]
MEEKTMEITKLKIELNAQKHLKEIRFQTFGNIRELRAKFEYDDLIREFFEQCNIVDVQYVYQQLDKKAMEEQEYNVQVYENSMLANLDAINFDEASALEEELVNQ